MRVIYHATYTDADPTAQTITILSDGGRKFRVTFDPPGYDDFIVSDGVKTVESSQGELQYTNDDQTLWVRIRTEDLPKVCPKAKLVRYTKVLGRSADRYTCPAASPDDSSEITIDSDSGILLALKSATATIAATRIDMNPTIPAGSFDLPNVPSLSPEPGSLSSKSPGVRDARNAATAIEKCRADAHGAPRRTTRRAT